MTDAPAPMDEETLPPEEEEDETCMYSSRFDNAHGYSATGTTASTLLKICRKANPDVVPKGDPPRRAKSQLAKFEKLLDSEDGAKLKAELLRYRRRAIKKWNKERRAEEKAAAGVVDDGPLSYPETGESTKVLEGALGERDDLLAAARERFGEDLNPRQLAQKLSKSNASEDRELVEKLIVHRNARAKAYRESLSSAGGRTGRGGRALGSSTAAPKKATRASWIDAAGKNAATALAAALKPLDYTPPEGAEEWETIAKTVSSAAARVYTGKQCYYRASDAGLLKSAHPQFKVGDVHIYAPQVLTARNMSSLVAAVDRKHFTREAIEALSTPELYERASDVYNLGIRPLREKRKDLIQLLLDANHCAVDPRKYGVSAFERANTPQFRRELRSQIIARSNVQRSFVANEARLGPPSAALPQSGADAIALNVGASRTRLAARKYTAWSKNAFGLEPGEEPPNSAHSDLRRYFLEEIWEEPEPGVFDPKRQCACCHRLYIDTGGKVWIEHFHGDDEEGLAVARDNGGCRDPRLYLVCCRTVSTRRVCLLVEFCAGLHCNITGFELFDSLGPGTAYDLDRAGKHRVVDGICDEYDF
jgi:uncharacterized protein YdhG (YjbR/CyaY superfamily)